MIGDTMFRCCTGLSSVTIPSSLTSIGHNAFHECTSLTSITLLDNVTSMGRDVFVYADNVVITCYPGSYVDEWAAAYGVKVKYLTPLRIPGDADSDGEVSIMDALLILQHSVGWNVKIDTDAGDVNASGAADIMDALLVLQHSVGWDVELK